MFDMEMYSSTAATPELARSLLDAHALGQSLLRILDCVAAHVGDGDARAQVRGFREQCESHLLLLNRRLQRLGRGTFLAVDLPASAPFWLRRVERAVRCG